MINVNMKSLLAKVVLGLACVAGLWLLGAMLMSPPGLNASDLILLPFDSPLLSVRKTAAGNVIGAPITYTITVSNNASDPAHSVVVTDAVPVGGVYVSGETHWNHKDMGLNLESVNVSYTQKWYAGWDWQHRLWNNAIAMLGPLL